MATAQNPIMNLPESVIAELRDLVRINVDSSKGLQTAADRIKDTELAATFRTIAQERAINADKLGHYLEMNDEEANGSGTIAGKLHRWWLNIRDALSSKEKYAILAEAERGEDEIKDRYEVALRNTAGSPIHDVLMTQMTSVKEGHDQIRDLRDAAKKECEC